MSKSNSLQRYIVDLNSQDYNLDGGIIDCRSTGMFITRDKKYKLESEGGKWELFHLDL